MKTADTQGWGARRILRWPSSDSNRGSGVLSPYGQHRAAIRPSRPTLMYPARRHAL